MAGAPGKVAVEHYRQGNITWAAAQRMALIISDAFQKDFSRREFYPEKYYFGDPLPPISDYEALLAKARAFKELVDATARNLYLLMRSDDHVQTFMFRETWEGSHEKGGRPARGPADVGLSLWRLPEYVHVEPKASVLYRLQTWLLRFVFRVQDWWVFGSAGSPLTTPALVHEFQLGYVHCNIKPTPERVRELEALSGDELAAMTYPAPYNYRLSQFCVTHAAQGKGYGRYMMDESIAQLRQMIIQDPPNLRGPAKIGFFSAPDARAFYKKYGFTVGATWDHELASGSVLPHTYFFMNLT